MRRLVESFLCILIVGVAAGCGSSNSGNSTADSGLTSSGGGGRGGSTGGTASGGTGGTAQTGGTDAGTYYWKLSGGYVGQFANDRNGETITTANGLWTLAAGNGSGDPVDIGIIINFSSPPQTSTTYTLADVSSTMIAVTNKKAAGFAAWDAGASFAGSSMQLTFDSVSQALAGAHGSFTGTLVPEMFNDADATSPVLLEGTF